MVQVRRGLVASTSEGLPTSARATAPAASALRRSGRETCASVEHPHRSKSFRTRFSRPGRNILNHDQGVLDVLVDGEHRDEVEVLEDEADPLSRGRRSPSPVEARNVDAGHLEPPLARLVEAADEVQQVVSRFRTSDEGNERDPGSMVS